VLAYLFWHTPIHDDVTRYEAGLDAFHRAVASAPPGGFVRSWTLRVTAPAWLPAGPAHYLDWYVVEGFTALGALNDAAVTGARRRPHDAVAALTRAGTAGVAALIGGEAVPPAAPALALVDKPAPDSYDAFRPALAAAAAPASCWMRQMTLGPGPEFLVLAAGTVPGLPWPATTPAVSLVAAS
jgi:hypothetical protein